MTEPTVQPPNTAQTAQTDQTNNTPTTDLAIFDLDHTLLAGDSNVLWTDYLHAQGLIDDDFIRQRDAIARAYQQGKADFANDLSKLLLPLGNYPRPLLTQHRDHYFAQHVQPKLYAQGLALIEQHQQAGDTVVIISATNEFLIEPVGKVAGVTHMIGVTLEEDAEGNFTGGYTGTPSFGAGKKTRLNEWLNAQGRKISDYRHSYFYTDSINDAPLLEVVSHPIAVNPDERLQALATERGWVVLAFKES